MTLYSTDFEIFKLLALKFGKPWNLWVGEFFFVRLVDWLGLFWGECDP